MRFFCFLFFSNSKIIYDLFRALSDSVILFFFVFDKLGNLHHNRRQSNTQMQGMYLAWLLCHVSLNFACVRISMSTGILWWQRDYYHLKTFLIGFEFLINQHFGVLSDPFFWWFRVHHPLPGIINIVGFFYGRRFFSQTGFQVAIYPRTTWILIYNFINFVAISSTNKDSWRISAWYCALIFSNPTRIVFPPRNFEPVFLNSFKCHCSVRHIPFSVMCRAASQSKFATRPPSYFFGCSILARIFFHHAVQKTRND